MIHIYPSATRRAHKDANHDEVGAALDRVMDPCLDCHRVGGGLADFLGVMICGPFKGQWVPVEVKAAEGKVRKSQARVAGNGRGPYLIVRSGEDALRQLGVLPSAAGDAQRPSPP